MNDYFYQLDFHIFSDSEKDELIEVAVNHFDDFRSYTTSTGFHDGNYFWRGEDLYNKQFVKDLVSSCRLECVPVLIKHNPRSTVYKHVDDPNKRNTVLSVPLKPKKDYPFTYFFETRESERPAGIAEFLDMKPCLLNTQKVHGLINTSKELRINFQLMFNDSFEVVRNLLIENKLFL